MAAKFHQRSFYVMLLLFTLSLAIVSPINLISVQASDSSVREFILSFLSDVAGFGNDLHIVELYVKSDLPFSETRSKTVASIVFAYHGREYQALLTLDPNKRVTYYKLYYRPPRDSSPLPLCKLLERAKHALINYISLVNLSYPKELTELLSKAIDENLDKVEGTTLTLVISKEENCSTDHQYMLYVSLCYFKTLNISGYRLSTAYLKLSVSGDGFISFFGDSSFIKIASHSVKVSKEEAIKIATPYAEEFASRNGVKIVKVNATLTLQPDTFKKRSNSTSQLYLFWRVVFKFNTVKNGNYGYKVLIWADTGEVYAHGPLGFEGSISPKIIFPLTLVIMVVLSLILVIPLLLFIRLKYCK